jgi:prepilin-type N-terminal cleavage/methylation domain-containing protein
MPKAVTITASISPQRNPAAAFTLIELSVVLVIIGLIVGGILVGQELVHQAQIRAVVSQEVQFQTATATFREKYQCLPGDCANAGSFGFTSVVSNK